MQFNHTAPALSATFDDSNLVSAAGLVPVMRLADRAGLGALAQDHLTVPSDKGAHAGAKIMSLVAGMIAGADSIEDMRLLQHGGMRRLFDRVYAPSTLGSFLRALSKADRLEVIVSGDGSHPGTDRNALFNRDHDKYAGRASSLILR